MAMWFSTWFPDAKTENAKSLILYHDLTLVICIFVMVLVVGFLFIFLFSKYFFGGMLNRSVRGNNPLEIIWTIWPAVVLFGLNCVSLFNLYQMELGDKSEHVVKVIGHQWYWEYEYMINGNLSDLFSSFKIELSDLEDSKFCLIDSKIGLLEGSDPSEEVIDSWDSLSQMLQNSVEEKGLIMNEDASNSIDISVDSNMFFNGLEFNIWKLGKTWIASQDSVLASDDSFVPGEVYDVQFRNQSVSDPCYLFFGGLNELLFSTVDVMHSWGVPALGVKVDTIPGRCSSFGLNPMCSGVVYGFCYELCGAGHSTMPIQVTILDYDGLKAVMDSFLMNEYNINVN